LPQAADKERISKGHAYHTDSSTSTLNATANPGDQANRRMTDYRRKINDLRNYKLPSVAKMESMSKSYPSHTDSSTSTLNSPFIIGLENYRQVLEIFRQRNAFIRLAKTGSAKKDKSTKAIDGSQVFGPSY
jgi:hypothetical protein